MREILRGLLKSFVRIFGSTLIDQRTGEEIAKVIMFCWAGRIYLIGYEGKAQVIPVFLPQKRLTFWKRQIGFTTHPMPDFAHEYPAPPPG